jgi:iron complex outermembrane recepter protein
MKSTVTNDRIRRVVRTTLSGVSTLSLGALSAPLLAQNAAATGPSADQPGELQEVVVTGVRASLQRALDIKQQSLGVVDAISSEDIGQFPDANIGDAIGRIPGVTVNRGSLTYAKASGAPTATGQVQGINVRGFGGSFNEVLIEGRPIASGNGQTFNFSDFSAVYVGQVDVHKTPDMTLSSGSVASTVNVKFPNPFDHAGPRAQVFAQENLYQLDGGARPGFGALLSDTFADNKFGILIDGDYLQSHILNHHQDIVGWKGASKNATDGGYLACSNFAVAPAGSGCATVGPGAPGHSQVPTWYPQDMAMYLERIVSTRKDARVSIQWRPTDSVLVTLDDNFSSDNEHDDRFQRSTWFGSFPGAVQDANGTLTSFNTVGPTDFNSFVAIDYITTNTPGLNVQWTGDNLSAELDVSQSVSKYNPNGNYTDVDADTGYGGKTNNYTGGLTLNQNGTVLPYWSAYGPNAVASGGAAVAAPNFEGLSPFIIGSHVFPLQTQLNSDKVNQAKIQVSWKNNDTKITGGFQFVDDTWNTKQMDTFTNNYWQLWSGYGPASGNISTPTSGAGVALPANLFAPLNYGTWMPGYSGAGNLPGQLVQYSPYAVLNYLITQPVNPDQNANSVKSGYPAYTGGIPAEALANGTVQHVDRARYSPFVNLDQKFTLGSTSLEVNLGLRYQKTKSDVAGLASALTGILWNGIGDPTAYSFVRGTPTFTSVHNSYGYFLPALDLNWLVLPNLKVRADASRTEADPPNNLLIPNTNYGGRVNALTATGNNPNLIPYLSSNFDLGAEWYYGSNDYVSADFFFKHVTNFPTSSVAPLVATGLTDPAPAVNPQNGQALSATSGQTPVFSETTYTNALSANVHGVEVAWQQMLPLGFGYQINATYAHTDKNFNPYNLTSNQFALSGVGNSANLIAFYDNNGFQARLALQWQGRLLQTIGQEQGGGAFGGEPVYSTARTEVDFSTQYDINDHYNVYFEAFNLTNDVYHTYGRFGNQTLNLIETGRSFTLGARAKF